MMDAVRSGLFLPRVVLFAFVYTVVGVVIPLQGGLTTGYVIGLALTGLLYGLLLGLIVSQLSLGRGARIVVLLLPLYVIQFFNPILEGYLFTTLLDDVSLLAGALVFGLILSLIYAVVASFLFTPKAPPRPLGGELRSYFGQRPALEWVWRFAVVGGSWVLFYWIFGSIVAPIVVHYYTDPASGYNLVLPSLEVLLAIQAIRGFIYLGSLVPLLATLRLEARPLLPLVVGLLFVGGGLAVFVIVETFPVLLRVVHGLEIFADSLAFGAVVTFLLRRGSAGSSVS